MTTFIPPRFDPAALLLSALNHLVDIDPGARDRLRALEGREVELALQKPQFRLLITVRDGVLCAGERSGDDADLSLRTSAGTLIGLLAQRQGLSVPAGRVSMSGDADLARALTRFVEAFEPDIDELFARAFGDVVGVQLARGARGAAGWAKARAAEFAQATVEYFREERRDVVAVAEFASHRDAVEDLRDAVERTQVRLQRLERRRAAAK